MWVQTCEDLVRIVLWDDVKLYLRLTNIYIYILNLNSVCFSACLVNFLFFVDYKQWIITNNYIVSIVTVEVVDNTLFRLNLFWTTKRDSMRLKLLFFYSHLRDSYFWTYCIFIILFFSKSLKWNNVHKFFFEEHCKEFWEILIN